MIYTRILLSIILIFTIISCAKKAEDEIIGKWRSEKEESTATFFKDGTIVITGEDRIIANYKFLDDKRLRIDWPNEFVAKFKSPKLRNQTWIVEVFISKHKLILKDPKDMNS